MKGFSEDTLTYDMHSHGSPYGTNGPSGTYIPEINGSDLTYVRTSNKARYIFRTNNNPDKNPERGIVWQYGKDITTQIKVFGNFSKSRFSSSRQFNP